MDRLASIRLARVAQARCLRSSSNELRAGPRQTAAPAYRGTFMFARSRAPNPDEFASGLMIMDFVTTRRKAAEGLRVANEYERPSK